MQGAVAPAPHAKSQRSGRARDEREGPAHVVPSHLARTGRQRKASRSETMARGGMASQPIASGRGLDLNPPQASPGPPMGASSVPRRCSVLLGGADQQGEDRMKPSNLMLAIPQG